MSFEKIEFGLTSGEAEAAEFPHLIADGYFDPDFLAPLISQKKWLVLARKGAGKSILGEKIKQTAPIHEKNTSVTLTHLADFPYRAFSQLMPTSIESASRYPASWSWLLCLQLIDALTKHPGANRPLNIDANAAIGKLRSLGLLPTSDLQQLVVRSSKSGFKAHIPELLEIFSETTTSAPTPDLAFLNLVSSLKNLIAKYSFHGRQYLVIDGLDDILTQESVQYETLSALIFETARLNSYFKSKNLKIWIIVLCRTDIYEILPGANKNKIRQDSALEIDWYPPSGVVEQSKLISLANLRGQLSLKRKIEIFDEFMPKAMDHGIPTKKYLTDLTRHTPRDFIALLNHIQNFSKGTTLNRHDILDGVKSYSVRYFLPEIKDELVGYVSPKELETFLNAVGEIHERAFTIEKLESTAIPLGLQKEKLDILVHALFAASAIGMTWRDKRNRTNKFEFKFRNPNSNFSRSHTIVLHKGLWKALNVN